MPRVTPLPRCTPAQAGLDPRRIVAMIDDYQARGLQIHSFLLVRHGKVLCEGYYAPYGPDQLQTVFSLSKTFTSVAVGIAEGEGLIRLDEKVIDLFAEELAVSGVTPGKELESLTLRHLLRMSTGQPEEPSGENCWEDMRVAFLKQAFTDMPGEVFRYNTSATYMLSAALKKKGIDLEDYLQEKLFTPMGISGTRWLRDPHDICTGGFGFSLVPEVIAKLGVCILNDGKWEDKQLIPRNYVAAATRAQIYQAPDVLGMGDWNAGYGYQMWMCVNGCFRGDGMYGQLCLMDRRTDTVLAMTALVHDMGTEMQVYYNNVLNAYQPEPLPEDEAAMTELNARLSTLRYERTLPEDDGAPIPAAVLGRYENLPFGEMTLALDGDVLTLARQGVTIKAARGTFLRNDMAPLADVLTYRDLTTIFPVLMAWGMKDGALVLRQFEVEGMQEVTLTFKPAENGVSILLQETTNPGQPYTVYNGTIQKA
ncbi:MAG: serine hydrolase [Clostridiales bacterium]|nr:serine hydrolase [Clostridiales bacterium]